MIDFFNTESETIRILVVDDEPMIRDLLEQSLERTGYDCSFAENGEAALEKMALVPFDVVVTDIDMPGMGGLQLVRHLRANPRTLGIPIIMVTSDSEVLRTEALESGVNVVLGKPYPEEQLIAHIQRLVMTRTDALS